MTYTTLIEAETLLGHYQEADWLLVDCRFSLADPDAGKSLYAAGHIPGAIYAHLDDDLSGAVIPGRTGRHPLPEREKLIATFSNWGIDENVQVVAYDDKTGMVASRLWWLLRQLGHNKVAVLNGGFAAWVSMPEAPMSREVPRRETRRFFPSAPIGQMADADQVAQIGYDPAYVLVDSREDFRYRGEMEPIDPVAGHIPGAVNAFFLDNLDPDGYFRNEEKLRERFVKILGGRPAEKAVFYCGSGVSACHNLLAMAHAGLGAATIYPGSWSEWVTDPARPVNMGEHP